MLGYSEEMFELEVRVARARLDDDEEQYTYLAKMLRAMGSANCAVCGTTVRFHHLDGWVHDEVGMDHDARPDRAGFEWPTDVPMLGGRTTS